MREAISLERAAMCGFVRPSHEVDALVAELGGCLRAVLRDVLCGHLDPALRKVADELLEQVLSGTRREALEVVDVVRELGDDERRRVAERGAQPLDVRGVAGGQGAPSCAVAALDALGERRRRGPRRPARAARRRAAGGRG